MRQLMRRLGWLLAALALAGCAREAEPVTARPALWRATDGDTVIWLFGTIHLLRPEERWRSAAIERAIAESDTLITEIPAGDAKAQAAAFLQRARTDRLPPLAERLPADERPALAVAIMAARSPAAALDRMTSWGAALVIGGGLAREMGGTVAAAPEAVLAQAFATRRRAAFESFAGQLAMFEGLSEAAQRRLLSETIRDAANLGAEYGRLVTAWRTGDPGTIERVFNRAFAGMPELRAKALTDRNRAWADDLQRRAARPGTLLVAVGAGHMVGPKGLPALLSERGFRVARMQ